MADLIAEGMLPQQRWRRVLPIDQTIVIGRNPGTWAVPWDDRISRRHAELRWHEGRLEVRKIPTAMNPVFVRGNEVSEVALKPGDNFVIGTTTFTLSVDQVSMSLDMPLPREEQSFTAQYLQQLPFRNADQRIEVLSRLPEVIVGASTDMELCVRLVNMLMAGIRRADAVAVVSVNSVSPEEAKVQVLHWDRRLTTESAGLDFQPSARLILDAVKREQSVLHRWEAGAENEIPGATLAEGYDWAFCTPVGDTSKGGWAVYVAGRLAHRRGGPSSSSSPTDMRDDLKFTELVASILSSLRQLHTLQRKQASLGQFFAPAVMEAMGTADPEEVLKPRETQVSVLFCDLRGFSLEAERSADDLLGLLNRVSVALGVMTHHILESGGVVGDFQGDAAMGFWGWPLPQHDRIHRVCRAATAIRTAFEEAATRSGDALADFRMGIGIACGRAVAGKIGTVDQVKVTVFGPVVNLASRLEGMTKILRAPILIDETTAEQIRASVPAEIARIRRLAVLQPYGMDTAVEVSELLPPEKDYPLLTDEHLRTYEAALEAFLAGRWGEAYELLHRLPASDRPKDFLTVYIAQHDRTPPRNWDGVIRLTSKS
ncbi:MAG: adenylate/guanylate cyclase domain-containing protein [Pirellulales bacterium]|nr:adenylate/guanylate cyclase domain-containing protein [Pirellulales bacterium]